jgi:hypothetical protein
VPRAAPRVPRRAADACVFGGEFLQPPLLPTRRRANLDPRAAPFGQELLQRIRVPCVRRDDDLGRSARRRPVVLEEEGLEDGGHVLALDVLEMKAVAVDHLALAEGKDLHDGAITLEGQTDHIDGAHGPLVRGLSLGQALDRTQAIAVAGRVLEALLRCRLPHLLLQLSHDRPRLSREELDDAVDHPTVVLLRHVVDAGGEAALDVVVETRDAGVAARLGPLAGAVAKDPVEHIERLTDLLRVRVRPEVDDAAPVALAREHDARVVVLHRHGDVGERLVVAQADVERRPVALDEVLLQVQRFDLVPGNDDLDVGHVRNELRLRPPRLRRALKVAAYAWPQRLRLADVEHAAALVPEEVDARPAGQGLQRLLYFGDLS